MHDITPENINIVLKLKHKTYCTDTVIRMRRDMRNSDDKLPRSFFRI